MALQAHIPPDTTEQSTSPEHSVPMFWPLAAAMALGNQIIANMQRNLDYDVAVKAVDYPAPPEWATPNRIRLDLKAMRLREFSEGGPGIIPVLVDAPFAGHSATIADYDRGQSLVETMLANGARHLLVTDWKAATAQMRYFDIDTYLATLNVAIDDLGGKVHLVGLCQGGWLSAMYAARFPGKVCSLVLAGAPIDTDAGDGPIKQLAHSLPLSTYKDMVEIGNGLMLGSVMLTGWKNMHPDEQYGNKYLALYKNIEDKNYVTRTGKFESWYENAIDLPGTYYLQVVQQLFKENRFAKGEFIGLGRRLALADIDIPLFLLAGKDDDITTPEQVFSAAALVSTPAEKIVQKLVPGGHIGLFMGTQTLRTVWPGVVDWILNNA
jgi:polyhydroxyalkanoate depolymerase